MVSALSQPYLKYPLLVVLTLAASLLAPGHRWRACPASARPRANAGRVVVVRKPNWAAGKVKTVRRVAPAAPR